MKILRIVAFFTLLIALGFAFIKNAAPGAQEPQAIRAPEALDGDDDIKPAPHPDWKLKWREWIDRGAPIEIAEAPAPPYKVPCRLYATDGCGIGGPCGEIRRLSPVDLYKKDCEKLRRNAR